MFGTIAFENIINDFISLIPRKINVKIRRTRAMRIDESLKIQIQIDGIYICNTQTISNNRVRPTSSSHMKISSRTRITYNIPRYQEIRIKLQFMNDFQFFQHTFLCLLIRARIAISHSFQSQFAQ